MKQMKDNFNGRLGGSALHEERVFPKNAFLLETDGI